MKKLLLGALKIQVLTVAFIILKLSGRVTWSWLWVLSPLWQPLLFILLIIIVVVITASINLNRNLKRGILK